MNRLAVTVAAVVVALLALALYGQEQRKRGAAEAMTARAVAEADSLRLISRKVERIYVRDTIRLWRTVARVDTMTREVERWKHDTTEVVRYVQAADSAIQACRATVLTCEERHRIVTGERDAWKRAFEAAPKPPSALEVWGGRLLWFGAGYGLGKVSP